MPPRSTAHQDSEEEGKDSKDAAYMIPGCNSCDGRLHLLFIRDTLHQDPAIQLIYTACEHFLVLIVCLQKINICTAAVLL